jgi:hypothetical protein
VKWRTSCRSLVFLVSAACDDPERVVRQWALQCLCLNPRRAQLTGRWQQIHIAHDDRAAGNAQLVPDPAVRFLPNFVVLG